MASMRERSAEITGRSVLGKSSMAGDSSGVAVTCRGSLAEGRVRSAGHSSREGGFSASFVEVFYTSLILALVAGALGHPVVPAGLGFGYVAAPATLPYLTAPAFTPVVAAAPAVTYHAAPAVATVAAAPAATVTKVDTYHAAPVVTSVAAAPSAAAGPTSTVTNVDTYHAAPVVTKVTTVEAGPAVPKVATVHATPAVTRVDTTYHAAPVVAATPAVTKVATAHAAAPTVTHVDTYQATPTVATVAAAPVLASAPAVAVIAAVTHAVPPFPAYHAAQLVAGPAPVYGYDVGALGYGLGHYGYGYGLGAYGLNYGYGLGSPFHYSNLLLRKRKCFGDHDAPIMFRGGTVEAFPFRTCLVLALASCAFAGYPYSVAALTYAAYHAPTSAAVSAVHDMPPFTYGDRYPQYAYRIGSYGLSYGYGLGGLGYAPFLQKCFEAS
ncbi:uncharacterized protein LOC119186047 [Rhipicephalus microplus]|uniref:uncharacterized protein LOC119186047 n=1 Tax=Rhipicephalus microplus TaxID=6941 RepID=UPI003F6B56EB